MSHLSDRQMKPRPIKDRISACIWVTALVFTSHATPALAQTEVSVEQLRAVAPVTVDVPATVELPINKVRVIDFDRNIRDVIVANPSIADVIVKTQTRAYLIGRSTGDTDILFIDDDGDVMEHIIVHVDLDTAAIASAMSELLPSADIELKSVNNSVVITGVVRTAKESADALTIASQFVDSENSEVFNMLRVIGDQQVLIKVKIAEMQRNVIKELGLSSSIAYATEKGPGSLAFNIATAGAGGSFTSTAAAATGAISTGAPNIPQTTYSALERQGLVKTLAEPVLTAISGESASFLVGGEFPTVGGVDSTGTAVIEFREFGVILEFTPVVMANDHISLRISAEVSRVSTENTLTLPSPSGTINVVGLSARRAESTVNLPSGGSLMIAGLLQNDDFTNIDGVPWLQNLPILGALFRSSSFQSNQSELVILVETVLVRPTDNNSKLALPTDGFVSASDFDLLVLGRLYKQYGGVRNSKEISIIGGPIGYLMR